MQAPIKIQEQELGDYLVTLLKRAEASSNPVIAVLDDIPAALVLALSQIGNTPKFTLFLTRRCEIPKQIEAACHQVFLPIQPLTGNIGGFFLCGNGAVFRISTTWHHTEDDPEIFAKLTEIGDMAIRITESYEGQ